MALLAAVPLVRVVREAIEGVVDSSRCARIIERALARHGLAEVPREPAVLGGWLRESLAPEVRAVAGEHAAHLLQLQLDATLGAMQRQTAGRPSSTRGRRQTRPGHGTQPDLESAAPQAHAAALPPPPPPAPETVDFLTQANEDEPENDMHASEIRQHHDTDLSIPVPLLRGVEHGQGTPEDAFASIPDIPCRLLVASADDKAVAALRKRFAGALTIDHMQHIGQLMEVAPVARDERVALILDCRAPTMHPASVAGLADELPYGWWVITWGIDMLTWDELEPDRQGPLHWVRCAAEAGWDEVLGLSSTLLAAGG